MRRREGVLTESSLKAYGRFLDFFGQWLGDRDPAEVTKLAEFDTYFAEWEDAYRARNGKEPSRSTIRIHETALATFYKFLVERGYAIANPLGSKTRTKRSNPKKGDHLSRCEFNALLAEPLTPQEKIIVSVYAWTAARASEVLSAAQRDVNLGDDTITVRKSKSSAGERIIPILPELRNAIEDWFEYLRKMGLRDDRLPLLVTKNRSAMKHSYAWRVLKRVAARAGVRERAAPDKAQENVSSVTLHTLRRTLSHHLLNGFNGREPVRIETVKALCGHENISTTLDYYAEVEQATMAAEIRRAV